MARLRKHLRVGRTFLPAAIALAAFFLLLFGISGCNRASNATKEVAYVNVPQVVLRDRLATIYEKKGTVKLGEKVYVLDRQRRFVLVRSERGEEGWLAERYLVSKDIFAEFQKLSTDNAKSPAQARGIAHAALNLHVAPGRDTEHLFQLQQGDKFDIVKRGTAEKPAHLQPVRTQVKTKSDSDKDGDVEPGPALEDWLLVRNQEGRTGWVLARMVDIDVPLEIAQYAEGQRIVSSFVLSEVQDADKRVPQYLVLLTETKDGLRWDFNQIRVFSWNLKRHRYETAYRERNLFGVFPVQVGTEDFGSEGVLPVFTLRVKNDAGQETTRKYRMIGPIIRRVATPEELKAEAAERAARKSAQRGKVAPSRR